MLDQIEKDLLEAMKSGDTVARDTLRILKSALKNAEIEKGSSLENDESVAVIRRELKRRLEAIEAYRAADKPELVASEEQEAAILNRYLPVQMSEEEVRDAVAEHLSAHPATPDKIGQTIGELGAKLKGRADMGLVAKIVRETVAA
jgi:uncharacterized protein